MAHIFADNVREGSVTEGTGVFITEGGIPAPGGVIIGRTLSEVLTVGDTFDYTIFHSTLNEWEIGLGEYIDQNTFSRSPTSSSNGGSLVNFSPGLKQVFIAPVAARMTDVISDANLPQTQTGKTFTSTVTVTGESGFRVNYDDQQFSIGGYSGVVSDFANSIRYLGGWTTWHIDTDKIAEGFRVRFHDSGTNYRDSLALDPDGTPRIGDLYIKLVSNSDSSSTTSFPVGHSLLVSRTTATQVTRNTERRVRIRTTSSHGYVLDGGDDQGALLAGTWRARGSSNSTNEYLMERVA